MIGKEGGRGRLEEEELPFIPFTGQSSRREDAGKQVAISPPARRAMARRHSSRLVFPGGGTRLLCPPFRYPSPSNVALVLACVKEGPSPSGDAAGGRRSLAERRADHWVVAGCQLLGARNQH